MKRLLVLFLFVLVAGNLFAGEKKMISRFNRLTNTWAVYPEVTIREIQEVPLESLYVADIIQGTNPSRWTLQTSLHRSDTVVVTALVAVPAKIITYTQKGYTMLLFDTLSTTEWGGVFVRCSGDTATHIADGFMNPERGNIIRMTGVVSEFPSSSMNSGTQFQPIPGIAIEILGSMSVPPPIQKTTGDFYQGIFSGGKVQYSTGEAFEGMIVELNNLTIDAKVNQSRGTFSAVDANGNQITMYDASRYFTLGSSTDHPYGKDPVWNSIYANSAFIGTKIDTIRGYITVASGQEAARGYRICPIYYGDIVFGHVLPSLSTHRRYPIVVNPDSTVLVTCKAYAQEIGSQLVSTVLYYSINGGPFIVDTMAYNEVDSTAQATIPQYPADTFIKYYIKAIDSHANEKIYASAASGAFSSDTSKGFFFYTVLNRALTIHDIQHTPFSNGRSAYVGAVVSIDGIVTADTANLNITAPTSGSTSSWYMQASNQPWNGIWFVTTDSILKPLKNGDSITVTGTVSENYDVTRLQYVTSVVVHSSGNPEPAPVVLPTSTFSPSVGNGNPNAEQWEGMLVKFNNVMVTDTFPTYADNTEWQIDDGSGPVLVQHGGLNSYSNRKVDTLFGKTILRNGNTFTSITGIIYYSFNRYKFVPRTDADFGTLGGTSVDDRKSGLLPVRYGLSQNYPNPFNPSTRFEVNLSQASHLDVTVYNLLGQKVATLVNEYRQAGNYMVTWNGTSQNGIPVNTGVYFVRMQADKFSSVRKIMLVK